MNSERGGRDGAPHSDEGVEGGFSSKTRDNNVKKEDELLSGNDGVGAGVDSEPAGASHLVVDLPLLAEGCGGQGGLPGGAGLSHPNH